MGIQLKVTTPRWLRGTLPRLQTMFHQMANEQGRFALVTPEHEVQAFGMVPKDPIRKAAILVPLVLDGGNSDKPSLLLTKRSSKVSTHKSQISFPGGHWEDEDESLVDTALREAQEECPSRHWSSTIIVGQCTTLPSVRGTPVTSVIGVVPETVSITDFGYNPDEVEEVFLVALEDLVAKETSKPLGRISSPGPVFPTEHGDIWGLTAFIIRPILHKLLKPVFVDGFSLSNNDNAAGGAALSDRPSSSSDQTKNSSL